MHYSFINVIRQKISHLGFISDIYVALYTTADSQIELMLSLHLEFSAVNEWLKANHLTLNSSKTKPIIFGTKHKLTNKADLNLRVSNELIERVSSMKYPEVILDKHLPFDVCINQVHSKSSKKTGNTT